MGTTETVVVPEKLSAIAELIYSDWKKQGKGVNYAAVPYLNAMYSLEKITDKYIYDSGASVVAYFLANAQSWKGPVAKAVKLKLNKMLKEVYGK